MVGGPTYTGKFPPCGLPGIVAVSPLVGTAGDQLPEFDQSLSTSPVQTDCASNCNAHRQTITIA